MAITQRSRQAANGDSPLVYLSTQFIQAKEYLEAIMASSSDAIVTTDMRGHIIYFSPGAERLWEKRYRSAMSEPVWHFYAKGKAEAKKIMRELLIRGSVSDHETTILTGKGKRVPVSMSVSLLKDRSGGLIGTLGISKDISRRVQLEERLRALTITDNLTGLYNQRHFRERADAEISRARRQGQNLAMLLLDLDNFKKANDQWGHVAGDRILRETAGILNASIRRKVDSAYRYGGDEFVILCPGLGRPQAQAVARRIQAASALKDYSRLVSLSIGIASLLKGDTADDLLKRADARMYSAKRRGHRRS